MSMSYEDITQEDYLAEQANEEIVAAEVNKRIASISGDKDLAYLLRILKEGESSRLEVKLSMDNIKDNVAKAICGLANQGGGKVVVGIAETKFYKPEMGAYTERDVLRNEFIAIGVKNPDKSRIDLSAHLRAHTNLGTDINELYNVRELNINGKKIVVFKVKPLFSEEKKIVLYKDQIYRRIDNQTVKLTMTDMIDLFNGGGGMHSSNITSNQQIMRIVDENIDIVYDAIRVVVDSRKASTSLIQRRLRIGYGRAARLIERLERAGIVKSADGSRPREVTVSDVEEGKKLLQESEAS